MRTNKNRHFSNGIMPRNFVVGGEIEIRSGKCVKLGEIYLPNADENHPLNGNKISSCCNSVRSAMCSVFTSQHDIYSVNHVHVVPLHALEMDDA